MRDSRYRVEVGERSGRIHMTVERVDCRPVRCGWDTLQRLKDEHVGRDVCMVEYFPGAAEVVNEINRRHFWSVPGGEKLPM